MRADRRLSARSSGPGGGGEDDPFGEGLPHARGAPVRCKDAARDAMQGPRDARPEALPDARRPIARSAAWQPPQLAARPLFPRGDRAAARGCRADPGNAFADASARGVTGIRWLHIAQCWAGACSWAAFSHWSPSFPAGEFWKQPSGALSDLSAGLPALSVKMAGPFSDFSLVSGARAHTHRPRGQRHDQT